MTHPQIKAKLVHAITDYDRRCAKRPGYNVWALPQYMARIDQIMQDIERGADVRRAIMAGFMGRLSDRCLKELGLAKTTPAEAPQTWVYTPETEESNDEERMEG